MYATQDDIVDRFGLQQVTTWSNFDQLGPNAQINAGRVSAALSVTGSKVDNLIANGPYVVPVQPIDGTTTPPELVDAHAELAGYWLWKTRGLNDSKPTQDMMEKRHMAAIRTLCAIRVGYMPIAAVFNTTRKTIPRVNGRRYGCR